MRIFQKGFNYSEDGPGNRLVYHLAGCNLRCPWCSNPEGLPVSGGEEADIAALAAEAVRCRMMFFDGGGVTLTGGEVTLFPDEVTALLAALRREGINTAVETNGISPCLPMFFPYLDHLLCDVKHYDPEKHRAVTGLSNEGVAENLRKAIACGFTPAVRIPLIGGFNAEEADAFGFAACFAEQGLAPHITVELLPYHEYGKDKYKKLGIPYTMTGEAKVSPERVAFFRRVLTDAGITLVRS